MAPISGSSSSTSSAPPSVSSSKHFPAEIIGEIARNADGPTITKLAYAGMSNLTMRYILGQAIKQKGLPADLMDRIPQTDLDQLREHLLVPDAPARGAPLGIEHLNRTGKEVLAGSRYATGDLLAELYEHSGEDMASNFHILEGLGVNPNTPEDILDKLARPDSRVWELTARNRSTAAETLDRLARNPDRWVRMAAAGNESMAAEILNRLASDPDPEVQREAVSNGRMAAEPLDLWASDPDPQLRQAVASNRSTAAETLNRLAGDRYLGVRLVVAHNRSTAAETLNRLAGDEVPVVRLAVARNESTAAHTLNRLASDENPGVQQQAADTLNWRRMPHMEKAVVQLLLFSRSQADGS